MRTDKDNCKRFFVWKMHTRYRYSQIFDPITRRLTKLKPDEIFNTSPYLGMRSMVSIRSFFILKIWTRNNTWPDWSRRKVPFAIFWCPNKIIIFIYFLSVNKKSKLWNFEANRTKIAEVTAEWNFCRSYIIRYELILQVKLFYYSLLKVS